PGLPVGPLVDGELTLPRGIANSFRLDGSAWEVPSYDNADVFVKRLVGAGLLVSDPVARAAVKGRLTDLSERSVQRRVRQATGLTLTTIRQIERANMAVELLEEGASIVDVVACAGYSDQAHLTRSLKRFVGQTPAQIIRGS